MSMDWSLLRSHWPISMIGSLFANYTTPITEVTLDDVVGVV